VTGVGRLGSRNVAAGAPPSKRSGWSLPGIPPKYLSSVLITLILVIGQLVGDIVGGYDRLAMALGAAMATEALLSRTLRGKWPVLLSAYISGNSVAILIKPAGGLLWPIAFGSILAIASKYVLTYRDRHLWNPTNLSISALLLLAPGSVSILSHQWGNQYATWIVAVVGLLVVWRANLLHITGTYIVAFLALAWLRSGIEYGFDDWRRLLTEAAPLTGPMYMLLIFFMLTDPRTSVGTRGGRILVAVVIALVECGIRMLPLTGWHGLDRLLTAPPIFALFLVGPLAMWVDLRRARPAVPA
jgi:hypothetical protein